MTTLFTRMRSFLPAALVCLAAPGADAASASGAFAVDGLGSQPCHAYLTAIEDDAGRQAFGNWAAGFLTGINVLAADTFDITPWQSPSVVLLQLRTFCEDNPDTAVVEALGLYVSAMEPDRLRERSEIVQMRRGGRAVPIYRSVLARVADKLAEAGAFTPSDADPLDHRALSEALIAYQVRSGLPETGLPDTPTLARLLDTR